MTIEQKLRDRLDMYRHLVPGARVEMAMFDWGNSVGWAAEWQDGTRHGVRKEYFIPAGGLTDAELDDMTVSALAALRERREGRQ